MFKLGDTVQFDSSSLNKEFWDQLPIEEKRKYYGVFYHDGTSNLKLFTFITEHFPQTGHCILMDMRTGELLPMCHACNFRLVNEDEC